ncbi:putative ABC transport system permease protein [Ferrimonas sediminum]|uniref:Putative ABC transport system permease protein n=1 Tax=Ferrimonas sediminum TaxID=718193 RepID=A0A1G8YPC6_9GAMM|nr:FtsX-like permease family protein [Ferrimonas sediminum]SDK04702.1 putative ABC transport system permease protein [Ferrimonas sediminum]
MSMFPLAWRLFRRELTHGQLRLIAAALILAVGAVTALALISSQLQASIVKQASTFLAADRVLTSPQEVDPQWLVQAQQQGLEVATTLEFQSMLFAGDRLQLVTVKAVSDNYPLRGRVELVTEASTALPASGSLWLDSRLAGWLTDTKQGEIGVSRFTLDRAISRLPDGGFNLFASAPVVLMNLADVAATGVVQPGSRLSWRYQFVGQPDSIQAYAGWLKSRMTSSQRLVDVRSDESPVSRAIARAEQFLLLTALLGIALACAAISVATQRYCQRHYDAVAMLKTLGASHNQVRSIFVMHLALVTLMGIGLGLLMGVMAATFMVQLLPSELVQATPQMSRALLLGAATGIIAGFGFTLYPLLRLLAIPPLRVLRKDLGPVRWQGWLNAVVSVAALALLAYLYSDNAVMTGVLLLGGAVLAVMLLAVAWLLLHWGRQLGMRTGTPLQLAVAGLRRRARENAVQLVGFSVSLVLLLTILALRQDLLADWQKQLPQGTPDHFLVNISPDNLTPMGEFLASRNVDATDFYPVIRGRLSAINGDQVRRPVTKEDQPQGEQQQGNQRGPQGIGRELNLTFRTQLPPNNPIEQGDWFRADAAGEVSVESQVADRLGIKLGDSLAFAIDGQQIEVRVTSLRKVNWETMQPNFFMIFPPEDLSRFPATYIASFKHPVNDPTLVPELIQRFPTVSVIDVGAIIEQLRDVIDQVSLALTLVLLVVIVASAMVLIAQTEAGMSSRKQELAIMRTLGAPGSLLRRAVAWEFLLMGAVSGVLAVVVTELTLALLKSQVFNLVVNGHTLWWLVIPLLGAVLIGALGMIACRRLLANQCAELLKG